MSPRSSELSSESTARTSGIGTRSTSTPTRVVATAQQITCRAEETENCRSARGSTTGRPCAPPQTGHTS